MGSDYCVAPGHPNTVTGPTEVFVFGIGWGDGLAWSDDAILRIVSDDGSEQHDFQKGDGQLVGDCTVFTFPDSQPGIQYRGVIVDGDLEVEHFGVSDLCALQHANDPTSHLPFPDEPDALADATDDGSDGWTEPPEASDDAGSDDAGSDDDPASGEADGPDPDADESAIAKASTADASLVAFS